jgi:uncharacterized DUF497 family protein
MDFEWDEEKNKKNISRRGIDFQWAVGIFEEPTLERPDTRRDYGEARIIATGVVDAVTLTVVYTWRGNRRRIIAAWKAHDSERQKYRQLFPEA